jgi:hypothetical protein
MFSDEELRVGNILSIEFFLPVFLHEIAPATCTAAVVWVERLPKGGRARFDVGMRFVRLEEATTSLLASVLGPPAGHG